MKSSNKKIIKFDISKKEKMEDEFWANEPVENRLKELFRLRALKWKGIE